MNEPSLEQMLEAEFTGGSFRIGEVIVRSPPNGGFEIRHRGEEDAPALKLAPEEAINVAKFDDAARYRSLRTAPNLRHGWTIFVPGIAEAVQVIDAIYPARLAAWRAWKLGRLATTPLRETLNRQSGMYRAAAKISEPQLDELIGNFCRSDGGCLRTILWRRDRGGKIPSSKLPATKFDPVFDQTGLGKKCIPLLCQEACNLLVAACRDMVKGER